MENALLYNCLVGLITCTLFEIGEMRRIRSRSMKVELYRYRLASRVCGNLVWFLGAESSLLFGVVRC